MEVIKIGDAVVKDGFQVQYNHLYSQYGQQTAERYRALIHGGQPDRQCRQPRERWVSNTLHRQKTFNDMQAQIIRSEYSAGLTCRTLAQRWGCSQGLINNVIRQRGAYRDR